MNPSPEAEPTITLQRPDWTDRLAHFAFTGIWVKEPKSLSSSMGLSGLGSRGTNLMVNAYLPPEILESLTDGLVK